MKKTKIIVSLVLSLSLLVLFVLPVCAVNISLSADKAMSAFELGEKYMSISEYTDEIGTTTIYNDIDVLKVRLKTLHPNISDVELAKQIHIALGDSEDLVNEIPEDKLLEVLESDKCVVNTSYVKATEYGSVVLTEAQALNELARKDGLTDVGKSFVSENIELYNEDYVLEEEYVAVPMADGVVVSPPSADGYMQITTRAYYLSSDNYRDYYQFRALAEWLMFPAFTFEDVLVMRSDANYANNYNDYGYHSATYVYNGTTTQTTRNYIEKNVGTNAPGKINFEYASGSLGLVLRFDVIPSGADENTVAECTNMRSFMYCKGSFPKTDGYVQASYCHAKVNLSISVSIPWGISFEIEGDSSEYHGEQLTIYYEGT